MKNKIKKIAYIASSGALMLPTLALGQGYEDPNPPGGVVQDDGITLLENVINGLLAFVGVVGVLGIIVGGIFYLTSGGDEGRIDTAKKWIMYSIVGIIVALVGYVIVRTVTAILTSGTPTF